MSEKNRMRSKSRGRGKTRGKSRSRSRGKSVNKSRSKSRKSRKGGGICCKSKNQPVSQEKKWKPSKRQEDQRSLISKKPPQKPTSRRNSKNRVRSVDNIKTSDETTKKFIENLISSADNNNSPSPIDDVNLESDPVKKSTRTKAIVLMPADNVDKNPTPYIRPSLGDSPWYLAQDSDSN